MFFCDIIAFFSATSFDITATNSMAALSHVNEAILA